MAATAGSRAEIERVLAEASEPLLVHFTAPWCPPCRMQSAEATRFAESAGGIAGVLEIDVADHGAFAEELGIAAVPTLVFYREGKELARWAGFRTAAELEELLAEILAGEAASE